MRGLHLTADLQGCPADGPLMRDDQALRAFCLAAVARSGLNAVDSLFHRFATAIGEAAPGPGGGGVTGVVLLAESHLAIHTWPELGAVTLDVHVCNLRTDNRARAQALISALESGFGATQVTRQRLDRAAIERA